MSYMTQFGYGLKSINPEGVLIYTEHLNYYCIYSHCSIENLEEN